MAVSNLARSVKEAISDGLIDKLELAKLKKLRADIAQQADEVIFLAENIGIEIWSRIYQKNRLKFKILWFCPAQLDCRLLLIITALTQVEIN